MKRIIGVLIWTLLFISLGIYSENKIYDFTNKFKSEIELIQKNIEDDNLEKVSNDIKNGLNPGIKKKKFGIK